MSGTEEQGPLEATVATTLRVLRLAVLVLVLVFLGSGGFVVSEHEVAFVRRQGKVVGTGDAALRKSGMHWAWPVLDEVERVPSGRAEVASSEAFALDLTPQEKLDRKPPTRKEEGLDPSRDGYLVLADGSLLHARPEARYRVRDPMLFVERSQPVAPALVRVLLERATARAAASQGADELVPRGDAGFREGGRTRLLDDARAATARVLDDLRSGIEVVSVGLLEVAPGRDLAPPPQVREAFQAVQRAHEGRAKRLSLARTEAAQVRAAAAAATARSKARAEALARRTLADAASEAAVFRSRLEEERRSGKTLRARLLAEALEVALAQVEEAFLLRQGEPARIRLERDTAAVRSEIERRLREAERE